MFTRVLFPWPIAVIPVVRSCNGIAFGMICLLTLFSNPPKNSTSGRIIHEGCVLVTDAMAAMGLGNGTHSLGNMSVRIQGDRATLSGTDTLAGSVVSMDSCVRRFKEFTGCSVGEALICATYHPAVVLKRHVARRRNEGACLGRRGGFVDAPIGVLEVGARADLVLVDDDLKVWETWVGGRLVFERKKES